MEKKPLNLTNRSVRGLSAAAAGKQVVCYDGDVIGLLLLVTETGVKTF